MRHHTCPVNHSQLISSMVEALCKLVLCHLTPIKLMVSLYLINTGELRI